MKKVFTLLIALAFGLGLKAQCPLTQAVDFTATDCHGTQVHLFDILDSGQAVLIDFFFTTCGPCQQATPKVVESYSTMGCNMHDVFYMEISPSDADPACQNWANNYGVEYPTIGTSGGGSTICNTYQIGAYPTLILIMPNRQIVIQDLWPISNAQTVVTALGQHGLQPHDCNAPSYDPKVSIDIDEVTESSITATFTPNEDCASYYYVCGSEAEFTEWVSLQGNDLPAVMEEHGVVGNTTLTLNFNDLLPETEYAVVALPVDPDGNYGDASYELVSTPSMPVVYDETLTFSMDTIELPYAYGAEITVYNNTSEDAIIHSIKETNDWNNFCIITFIIDGNEYCCPDDLEIALPIGESLTMFLRCDMVGKDNEYIEDLVTVSSNLPDASFTVMVEHAWSVNENEATTTLYPNPANDFVTLKGEDLGTVRVYNALGQKVEEFEANGVEININTAGYENGVYVVKAGEKALRFVVRH